MGLQTRCHARFGRRTSEGKAHLESDRLTFRGDFRVTVPFKAVTRVSASDKTLSVEGPDGLLALDLGLAAEQWAKKIRTPRSRIDKLGVKPDARVSVVGLAEPDFDIELARRSGDVSRRMRKGTHIIFVGVKRKTELERIARARRHLADDGAVWVVYPKGRPELSQSDVMRAGKAAGLVDIKVVGFSSERTALKFVIPAAKRAKR